MIIIIINYKLLKIASYHKNCINKLTCLNKECPFKHDICYEKRKLIYNIYQKFSKKNKKKKLCKFSITCYNKDCEYNHELEYKYRNIIYNIILAATPEIAIEYYKSNIDISENEIYISDLINEKKKEMDKLYVYTLYTNSILDKIWNYQLEFEKYKKIIISQQLRINDLNIEINNLELTHP